MKLLVVITSYRAKELTINCLRSLEKEVESIPDMKVGICDNGNEDDTAEVLNHEIHENGWERWAYVKSIYPNKGFTGGNNAILKDVIGSGNIPDFFLLLNADTIVLKGAIVELLNGAEKNSNYGLYSPRLESLGGDFQVNCFRFISPISEMLRAARTSLLNKALSRWVVPVLKIPENPMEVEWTGFACVLIRKEILIDIGILDEKYFLYFDDVDYCRSAKNAGWKVFHWPHSTVIHLEGQSNPVNELTMNRKRRPGYWYRSRSYYFKKFYGNIGLILANLLWWFGRSISLFREILGFKKPHVCEKEWLDIWKGFI